MEFLGKDLARFNGGINVTNNTVHDVLQCGERVHIYQSLFYYI